MPGITSTAGAGMSRQASCLCMQGPEMLPGKPGKSERRSFFGLRRKSKGGAVEDGAAAGGQPPQAAISRSKSTGRGSRDSSLEVEPVPPSSKRKSRKGKGSGSKSDSEELGSGGKQSSRWDALTSDFCRFKALSGSPIIALLFSRGHQSNWLQRVQQDHLFALSVMQSLNCPAYIRCSHAPGRLRDVFACRLPSTPGHAAAGGGGLAAPARLLSSAA